MVDDEVRGESIGVDEAIACLTLSLVDGFDDEVEYSILAVTLLDKVDSVQVRHLRLKVSFLDVDVDDQVLFGVGVDQVLADLSLVEVVAYYSVFLEFKLRVSRLQMEVGLRRLNSAKLEQIDAIWT